VVSSARFPAGRPRAEEHHLSGFRRWVQIWQYVTIASNNDKQAGVHTGVRVERGAVIGAHALIMCPADRTLTIGEEAVIGAGAIVVDDVPARALVLPEPSRVIARSD
jgi:serine acetyltransferase